MMIRRRLFHFSSRNLRNAKDSFDLLDGLAKSATSCDNEKLTDWLQGGSGNNTVDPLNNVLVVWKSEYLKTPEEALNPKKVLEKVDEWKKLVDSIKASNSLQQQVQKELEGLLRPDVKSYTHVIQAVATSIDDCSHRQKQVNRNKLEFIDALLERLIEESKTDFSIQPNVASFSAVMNAWAKTPMGKRDNISFSSDRVEELLRSMEELHEEGRPNLEPNTVIYNILLNAWAKEGKVKQIEDTLQRMIRLEIPSVTPDSISYSTLLSAYARLATAEAAEKADYLLNQMIELYNHGVDMAKPNVISFSNVIQCHAHLGDGNAAEEWLRKLQDMYRLEQDSDLKADVAICNMVLQGWVNAGKPEKAEDFLRRMMMDDETENELVRPNSRTFNIVLSAWAKIGEAERAEAMLMEMYNLYVNDDFDTRPTVVSYNTVLDSYAQKTNRMLDSNKRKRGARSQHKLNIRHTNANNSGEDAPWNRAQAILSHMIDLYEGGDDSVKPTARTWNTVINVCAKAGKIDQAEKILGQFSSFSSEKEMAPSVRTWNVLLSSCVSYGNTSKANQFLKLMKENRVQPDIVSYNTFLNCYVHASKRRTKSSNANAQEAFESIIHRLWNDTNVTPNNITYLAVINFWINERMPKRAEAFLLKVAGESQESNRKSTIVAPNRDMFHYVLTSWGEHREPRKAEGLLLKMAALSDDHGFDVRPTTETYNRLLNCWAKSMKVESGERAEVILREMEGLNNLGDDEATPDIYSYNSVLNAWSNSGDKTALTRIDALILEMILKGNPKLLPDSFSYGTWLKAIARCDESERKRRLEGVMKTMKIHEFEPNNYIQQRIRSLTTTSTKK